MFVTWIALLAMAVELPGAIGVEEKDFQHFANGPLTDAEVARIRKAEPGMTDACAAKIRAGGLKAIPERTEDCVAMTPSRRWTGLWRNDFEGSQFCAAPAKTCGYVDTEDRKQPLVWMRIEALPTDWRIKNMGGLYAVEFVGRRTAVPGHHGHFGMFDAEVIVDRLISIREVEAPPPPATKAETIRYWKQCEASGTCIPDWEAINKSEDAKIPEENYDFLSVADDRCVPKIGIGIEPKYKADCERMAEPRRYRGTWYVDFETSFFTPAGKRDCMQTDEPGDCLELTGEALPWPPRSDCGRKFEVEFIGRRNVYRKFFPHYTIMIDDLISAKRLPDPYDVDCDPKLPPELKAKK